MAIMITVAELMARCFCFLWKFVEFLYFLDCPPRILGGFVWRLQKEPPISNSKVGWGWFRNELIFCRLIGLG